MQSRKHANHKLLCYLAEPTTPDMMLQCTDIVEVLQKHRLHTQFEELGPNFKQDAKNQPQTLETPRTIRNASSVLLKISTINQ